MEAPLWLHMTSGVFHVDYIPGIVKFALQVDLLDTWATVPQFWRRKWFASAGDRTRGTSVWWNFWLNPAGNLAFFPIPFSRLWVAWCSICRSSCSGHGISPPGSPLISRTCQTPHEPASQSQDYKHQPWCPAKKNSYIQGNHHCDGGSLGISVNLPCKNSLSDRTYSYIPCVCASPAGSVELCMTLL